MNASSILTEQPVEAPAYVPAATSDAVWLRFASVETVLLVISAFFFALHFVHLRADFPNHSPWMDWAKYTDEGWYGDAAIRHYQLGHWNVPGDFNPAAALPVWPLIEMAVFRVTGVSLVAARTTVVVVFGLIMLCSYLLMRRWRLVTPSGRCTEFRWESKTSSPRARRRRPRKASCSIPPGATEMRSSSNACAPPAASSWAS